jgi:hypothetical protein
MIIALYNGITTPSNRNIGIVVSFKIPWRVNIPWMKIDPRVNIPWGSKYHMTLAT